jgi:hypothetical protein
LESYVVRVYRSAEDDPDELVGVIEDVGEGKEGVFTTLNELWDLLNPAEAKPERPRENKLI